MDSSRSSIIQHSKNIQDCSRRMRTPVGAVHNKESQGRHREIHRGRGTLQLPQIVFWVMCTFAFIPLKYVPTTICICKHFPPAPYKQYCPTIVIVYVCPQIYSNDSTQYASKLVLYVLAAF